MRNATWIALSLCVALGCGSESGERAEPVREEPAAEPSAADTTATEQAEAESEPSTPSEEPEVATVGEPAPDFTLTDQAGQEHRLSQYRGRIVVLEWINPECPYVKRHYEAGTMTKLVQSFPEDRVVWLAIDSSHFVKPEDSQAWREQHSVPYPILQDPSGTVGRRYAARTTPHMYVIDQEGILRYAGGIDDDPRGTSENPTNYVEPAVNALLKGEPVATQTSEPYGCTVKYEEA